jgi:hypothetical protein
VLWDPVGSRRRPRCSRCARASPRRARKQPASSGRKELSAQEFRDLLAKGTIAPIDSMKGEDAFKGAKPEMDDLATPPSGAQKPNVQGPPAPKPEARPQPPENPYLAFGERIKVNPDGTITKPFPLRIGTGEEDGGADRDLRQLPAVDGGGAGPSTPEHGEARLTTDWDIELYQDLRNSPRAQRRRTSPTG